MEKYSGTGKRSTQKKKNKNIIKTKDKNENFNNLVLLQNKKTKIKNIRGKTIAFSFEKNAQHIKTKINK